MRQLSVAAIAIALVAACRGDHALHGLDPAPDAQLLYAGVPSDGAVDGPVDAAPATGDGIAAARAAADGTGLSLAIRGATVTYEKPQIGSVANDPAGIYGSLAGTELGEDVQEVFV